MTRTRRPATTGVLLALLVLIAGAAGLVLASPAAAADEGVILQRANEARADAGLPGLRANTDLDRAALDWAEQMAAMGALSHNPDLGTVVPGGWQRIGENVAEGYRSGSAVHDGWMGLSGHRANILGDYTDMGSALIERNGTTWAVQVFAKYAGHASPAAPVPAASASSTPEPAAQPEPVEAAPPAPVETPPTPETTASATPETAVAPSAAVDAPTPLVSTPATAPSVEPAPPAEARTPFLATAAASAPLPLLVAALLVAAVLALVSLLLARRPPATAWARSGVSGAGRHRAPRRR